MDSSKKTKFIDNHSYENSLLETCLDTEKLINSNILTDYGFITNKSYNFLGDVAKSSQDQIKSIISMMMLESCNKAEQFSSLSSDLTIDLSSKVIKHILQESSLDKNNKKILFNEFQNIVKDIVNNKLKELKQQATNNILLELVEQLSINNKRLSTIALEAINLSGLEGNISLESTNTNTYSVELQCGYKFKVDCPKTFFESSNSWKAENVKILIIDGIIEQVSEIHNLLYKFSQTKEKAIFITRGFGDEVLSTLMTNQQRKTLNILPIQVPHDMDGVNMVNDMAIVCGCNLVSPVKGDFICNVKYEDLVSVDSVVCNFDSILIENSSTKQNVKNHIKFIQNKIKEVNSEFSDVYTKRIKSLNSHSVKIKLAGNTEKERLIEHQAMDSILRTCKNLLSNGFINKQKLIQTIDNKTNFNRIIIECIDNQVKLENLPIGTIYSSLVYSLSLINSLLSINCAIINDYSK